MQCEIPSLHKLYALVYVLVLIGVHGNTNCELQIS